MKSSILTSSLLVAFAQLQAASAASCKNGNNLERCFAKSAVEATSFCSSFAAAPTPVVAGFDCVTKKNGDLYATSSVASMCGCVLATATAAPPAPTVTITSVSVSTVTATAACTTSAVTPPAPSAASVIVHAFADPGCNVPSGSGPNIVLTENVCTPVPANSITVGAFTAGTYCGTDGAIATCSIQYFMQPNCQVQGGSLPSTETSTCTTIFNTNTMRLFCGCA